MSGSLNRATIIGNLTKDPEVKSFASGGKVCNLSIATNEKWKDKEGQQKEAVEYHNVAIFNEGLITVAETYLKKGASVLIEGQIKTRKWEKDGESRYSTEIVLRGFDSKLVMLGGREGASSSVSAHSQTKSNGYAPTNALDDLDSIPY